MPSLTFEPWVGTGFTDTSRWGCRLLLMGESHYDEGFGQGSQLTSYVVRRHINRDGKQYAFWTNIARTFEGRAYGPPATRKRFWDSVAFFNFIQGFVGDGPRQRPSEALWQDSRSGFWHVIEMLRPHCIVCFGFDLWDKLPAPSGADQRLNVDAIRGRVAKTRLYRAPSGHACIAGYLRHPSSGYSWRQWSEWATAILACARERVPDR